LLTDADEVKLAGRFGATSGAPVVGRVSKDMPPETRICHPTPIRLRSAGWPTSLRGGTWAYAAPPERRSQNIIPIPL